MECPTISGFELEPPPPLGPPPRHTRQWSQHSSLRATILRVFILVEATKAEVGRHGAVICSRHVTRSAGNGANGEFGGYLASTPQSNPTNPLFLGGGGRGETSLQSVHQGIWYTALQLLLAELVKQNTLALKAVRSNPGPTNITKPHSHICCMCHTWCACTLFPVRYAGISFARTNRHLYQGMCAH